MTKGDIHDNDDNDGNDGNDNHSDSDSDDEFLRQYAGRSVFSKRPKLETPNLTQSSEEPDAQTLTADVIEMKGATRLILVGCSISHVYFCCHG